MSDDGLGMDRTIMGLKSLSVGIWLAIWISSGMRFAFGLDLLVYFLASVSFLHLNMETNKDKTSSKRQHTIE